VEELREGNDTTTKVTTMTYSPGNRLLSKTMNQGDTAQSISQPTLEFDGFDRLKRVINNVEGKEKAVEYKYNGDDLRTQKTIKNAGVEVDTTNYLYDRGSVILTTDKQNNLKERYIKGLEYIARTDNNSNYANYLYNGHSDVVQLVNQAPQIDNSYHYDSFGNLLEETESYVNEIRYSGEFYDKEAGMYYLRARFYDPRDRRFVSEDSYWGQANNPLSLNRYTYCHNDPVNFIDPSGHWELGDEKLSEEAQKAIKKLTDSYFDSNNERGRKYAHKAADAIRSNKNNYVGENNDSFTDNVNSAIRSSQRIDTNGEKYITGDQWRNLSKKHKRRSKGRRKSYDGTKKSVVEIVGDVTYEAIIASDYDTFSSGYNEEGEKKFKGKAPTSTYWGGRLNYPDPKLGKEIVSIAIGFTPVDTGKDLMDLIKGKDIVTGEKFSRIILGVAMITPELGDKLLKQAAKQGDEVAEKIIKQLDKGTSNRIARLTRDEARDAVQGVLRNGEFGLDDLKSMIPDGVENTFKATDRIKDGQKYVFELADGQKATIRWHAPDPEAAIKYPGSASGTRWTAQIKVGNKSLGADGKWYKNQSLNIVHIPIEGM
jgi:RHS repeat-associated protein